MSIRDVCSVQGSARRKASCGDACYSDGAGSEEHTGTNTSHGGGWLLGRCFQDQILHCSILFDMLVEFTLPKAQGAGSGHI